MRQAQTWTEAFWRSAGANSWQLRKTSTGHCGILILWSDRAKGLGYYLEEGKCEGVAGLHLLRALYPPGLYVKD